MSAPSDENDRWRGARDAPRPWADLMVEAARNAQRLQAAAAQARDDDLDIPDPSIVAKTLFDVVERAARNPAALCAAQADLTADFTRLLEATVRRFAGEAGAPVAAPEPDDRRFRDAAWSDDPAFDFVKQAYLLVGRWLDTAVAGTPGLEDAARRRARFYLRQYVDALAPTNFAATNPEAIRRAAETGGESLLRGFGALLDDLERGGGALRPQMTDETPFKLGETIAATPGLVVARTDLAELIQYAPTTDRVDAAPMLIVPPWINKYYILDLRPENSFVKWLVESGKTVFVLSWINPDEALRHKDFEDYMSEGPIAALETIAEITGERAIDLIGYCMGGTLLAATLAYRAAMGEPPARSATFLTTMLDFAEPGELGVFIDEDQLAVLEAHMAKHGYLDGRHMARVFSLMRDRDMIWSVYVNTYLLGRSPRAFDLLYWNNDATRMPEMMQRFYLRRMYLENRLARPGGLTLRGRAIDLGRIDTPAVFVSAIDDHIAPWRSTYAGARLLAAPTRFILAESGHIAGIVNPPGPHVKYGWLDNPAAPADTPADAWFDGAQRRSGSWWPVWRDALRTLGSNDNARARPVGRCRNGLDPAPGVYVRRRC